MSGSLFGYAPIKKGMSCFSVAGLAGEFMDDFWDPRKDNSP